MEEEGNREIEGNSGGDDDDAKERSVLRSSVPFSLEKGVDEPWPLPLL